jgi:hypothetical protein
MQASGTKRAHDETEAAQPEVEQTPTGESAAQEDERPASTAHHEEAEESTAPQAKRSRTEKDAGKPLHEPFFRLNLCDGTV